MSEPRGQFSSIGAAIASRIPVDAQGNFPVNRTLVAVLAFGLAFFNEALFWLLAHVGREAVAGRFLLGSIGLGVVLWLTLVVVQVRVTGGANRAGWLVTVLTGGLVVTGVLMTTPACVLAGVGLLTAWSARGIKKGVGG